MSGSEKRIKVSNIANYYENPRHPIASDEFDTLKKLFDSVGIPQMLNLASDIKAHGLLPCNRIVVVYSEFLKKYVVYEGNRRVAAIKLLLYPDTFTFLDKATIDKVKKIVSGPGVDLSTSLNCYITDETEAFFIMERLHSGEDHGRGLKSWDAREKENFKVRQGNKQSLSNLIYLAWTLLLFYLLQPSNEFSTTERFVLKSGSMHQTNPRLLLIESSLSLKPQNGLLPNPIILKCPLHVFSIQQILSVINSALGLIPTIPRIPSLLPSLIL